MFNSISSKMCSKCADVLPACIFVLCYEWFIKKWQKALGITWHFPIDNGWCRNDEEGNDMMSDTKLGVLKWTRDPVRWARVSVLPEPWNKDPSLFISVYLVNHKHIKNEFSIQAQDNWPCVRPSSPASCHKASSKLRQLATMCLPH